VTGERVTLGVNPSGTTFQWGIAQPSASSRSRAGLDDTTSAVPTFVPDVAGTYAITALVDGVTTYQLRITVQSVSIAEPVEAVRFSPRGDSTIPAPAAGVTMYYSSDQDALCVKDPNGDVSTVDLTAVP